MQENIELRDGRLIFPQNGFSVDYRGPAWNITDTYFLSPHGHKIHFTYQDKRPVAIKFDKALLLQSLLEKCEKAGVETRFSTVAYGAQESVGGVELSLSCKGAHSAIKAKNNSCRWRKLTNSTGAGHEPGSPSVHLRPVHYLHPCRRQRV